MPSLASRTFRRVHAEAQTRVRPRLQESFELDGRRYPYFLHRKGPTWRVERIAELAIATMLYRDAQAAGARILEIGNVLQGYGCVGHTVVDKYEVGPGVINEDVVDFSADPFDTILSVSTIEHVGWDETPRDPEKIPRSIDNLAALLRPGGTLTVTVPHGYNRDLDDLLAADALPFDTVSYLARQTGASNHWAQVDRRALDGMLYGYPHAGANAFAVATLRR